MCHPTHKQWIAVKPVNTLKQGLIERNLNICTPSIRHIKPEVKEGKQISEYQLEWKQTVVGSQILLVIAQYPKQLTGNSTFIYSKFTRVKVEKQIFFHQDTTSEVTSTVQIDRVCILTAVKSLQFKTTFHLARDSSTNLPRGGLYSMQQQSSVPLVRFSLLLKPPSSNFMQSISF